MKKILLLGLALAALTLAACGDSNGDESTVTITYANWNLGTVEENNINRRMIQAFMDEHPGIVVEVDETITGDWMEALTMAAATNSLPDVFMINDVAPMVINGWLMDITEISRADAEFNRLPTAIREAVTLNDVVFSVPNAQHMIGFFANLTLFDALNLNPPSFGITPDEFFQAIRDTTDLNRPSIGISHLQTIAEWFPGAVNPNLGFFSFDGNNYNLNAPEMLEAVRIATELNSNGFTWLGLDDDQRNNFFGTTWDGQGFRDGNVAFLQDGTWAMESLSIDAAHFDWDFISVPGQRPVLTIDILGIASTSQHPEEAYLFAKWMGHGDAGFARRIELSEAAGSSVGTLPFTNNQTILDAFWANMDTPGLRAAYAALGNALIDGNKFVPGHLQARFHAPTGISIGDNDNASMGDAIWNAMLGNINFPDHAANLNAIANQAHQAELDQVNAAMGR